jgi:hypothetical protein
MDLKNPTYFSEDYSEIVIRHIQTLKFCAKTFISSHVSVGISYLCH